MKLLIIFIIVLSPFAATAWDGYDYDKGSYVEIEKGNLVREGQTIEIYDYGTGEYKDVEVQSITGTGSGAEVEVYDNNTGESRTLDMEQE